MGYYLSIKATHNTCVPIQEGELIIYSSLQSGEKQKMRSVSMSKKKKAELHHSREVGDPTILSR